MFEKKQPMLTPKHRFWDENLPLLDPPPKEEKKAAPVNRVAVPVRGIVPGAGL